jgi:hypothetical protein
MDISAGDKVRVIKLKNGKPIGKEKEIKVKIFDKVRGSVWNGGMTLVFRKGNIFKVLEKLK